MRQTWWLVIGVFGVLSSLSSACASDIFPLHEGEQTRVLIDGASAKGWNAVESTLTPAVLEGEPAMLFRVPVDWHGGEAQYPVGWPRIQTGYDATTGDWRGWDQIRLRLLPRSSSGRLPFRPLGLTISTTQRSGWERDIPELKYGQWQEVAFDLRELTSPEQVRASGLFISEDKYADGTVLEFYINRLELVRYTRPTVVEFTPLSTVFFTDAKSLPVRIKMFGIPTGKTVKIQLMLKRGEKQVAGTHAMIGNGETQLTLPLKQPVPPGDYFLDALVANYFPAAPVRFVTSPWQEAKP